jgi:chromosome segregation ATPase
VIDLDYEKELIQLKEGLEKAKTLKYKAEARLEQLKNQEDQIIRELKVLGVDPADLEKEIESLKEKIEESLKKANEMLPTDLLNK